MNAIEFLGAGEILGAMITPALLITVSGTLAVGLSASTKWALGWIPVTFGLSGAFALLIAAGC